MGNAENLDENQRLNIVFDDTIFGSVGSKTDFYSTEMSTSVSAFGKNGKIYKIKGMRFSDLSFRGEYTDSDTFETPGVYRQIIYVIFDDDITGIPNDRIVINERLALDKQIIMKDQNIVLLDREIVIQEATRNEQPVVEEKSQTSKTENAKDNQDEEWSEEPTSKKIITNPDVALVIVDGYGKQIISRNVTPASVWDVTAIRRNSKTGAIYYKIGNGEYLVEGDTIPYSEENLAEAKKSLATNPFYNDFLETEEQSAAVEEIPVDSNMAMDAVDENQTTIYEAEEIPERREKSNPYEGTRTLQGIVKINVDENDDVDVWSSYNSNRRKIQGKNIKGQTYWYTDKVGIDSTGESFYEIAADEWVAAAHVEFYDNY